MDLPDLNEEAEFYKGSGESVPLIGEEVCMVFFAVKLHSKKNLLITWKFQSITNDMSNIKIPHSMEAYCENLDQVSIC